LYAHCACRSDARCDSQPFVTMTALKTLNLKQHVGHFFTIHKTTKPVPNQKIKSITLSHLPDRRLREGKRRGHLRWSSFDPCQDHVSCYVRSVTSDQWTQHARKPSMGPRRKPRVLPRAQTRPEPPIWILDSQIPFQDHIDLEPSIQMLNSDKVVPLVWGPSLRDEDPPQKLSLLHWLQLSSMIPAIHGFNYAIRSSPCSDGTTPLHQCGLLWMVADISA